MADISVDDHDGATRITYRFDGNGKVFWKTEYVGEAIQRATARWWMWEARSILQIDLMGIDGASVIASPIEEGSNVTRMESAAAGHSILQSFVGKAEIRPGYTVSSANSPTRLTIDIPTVD